ncbi:Mss4-like protein, partial [Mycena galericulata]
PPGVLDALLRPSRTRPVARALDSFPGGVSDVSDTTSESESEPDNSDTPRTHNKYDLLCPRPGCGSVILRAGVGTLVERSSVQMEPAERTPAHLAPMPAPPAPAPWWRVAPSPMEFENIGFSKPVGGASEGGAQMKLLACAECDLGPVGWSEVGGAEFWVACSRVGYRA